MLLVYEKSLFTLLQLFISDEDGELDYAPDALINNQDRNYDFTRAISTLKWISPFSPPQKKK